MAVSRSEQLDPVQLMLEACDKAILDVLAGKTVTFNGRSVTRESLSEIRKTRQTLREELVELKRLGSGRSRFKYANLNPRF